MALSLSPARRCTFVWRWESSSLLRVGGGPGSPTARREYLFSPVALLLCVRNLSSAAHDSVPLFMWWLHLLGRRTSVIILSLYGSAGA